MKLLMVPISLNGQSINKDQFGYTLRPRQPFTADGVDEIWFWCRGNKNRMCHVALTFSGPTDSDKRRWHWDGNMESPTITPSIGCDARCGWHGRIINGDITP